MFAWIKTIAILLIVVFAIYVGVQFGMPYYRYYSFKTDAADIVRFKRYEPNDMKMKHIREDLLEKAQSAGMPISMNDIAIEKTETGFWVDVEWQETVNILNQYKKVLSFEVEVSS